MCVHYKDCGKCTRCPTNFWPVANIGCCKIFCYIYMLLASIFFYSFVNLLVPGECGTVKDCGDNAEGCQVIKNYTECICNPGFWYNPFQKRCGKIVWFQYSSVLNKQHVWNKRHIGPKRRKRIIVTYGISDTEVQFSNF